MKFVQHYQQRYAREDLNEELQEAARAGDVVWLEQLITSGADLNYQDKAVGKAALHHAADNGNVDAVNLLLQHGANPNIRDKEGRTPLHDAVVWNNRDTVKTLLRYGADCNAINKWGYTALHFAASFGHEGVAEDLLTYGANVNAVAQDGKTPDAVAANAKIVRLMLQIKGQQQEAAQQVAAVATHQLTMLSSSSNIIASIHSTPNRFSPSLKTPSPAFSDNFDGLLNRAFPPGRPPPVRPNILSSPNNIITPATVLNPPQRVPSHRYTPTLPALRSSDSAPMNAMSAAMLSAAGYAPQFPPGMPLGASLPGPGTFSTSTGPPSVASSVHTPSTAVVSPRLPSPTAIVSPRLQSPNPPTVAPPRLQSPTPPTSGIIPARLQSSPPPAPATNSPQLDTPAADVISPAMDAPTAPPTTMLSPRLQAAAAAANSRLMINGWDDALREAQQQREAAGLPPLTTPAPVPPTAELVATAAAVLAPLNKAALEANGEASTADAPAAPIAASAAPAVPAAPAPEKAPTEPAPTPVPQSPPPSAPAKPASPNTPAPEAPPTQAPVNDTPAPATPETTPAPAATPTPEAPQTLSPQDASAGPAALSLPLPSLPPIQTHTAPPAANGTEPAVAGPIVGSWDVLPRGPPPVRLEWTASRNLVSHLSQSSQDDIWNRDQLLPTFPSMSMQPAVGVPEAGDEEALAERLSELVTITNHRKSKVALQAAHVEARAAELEEQAAALAAQQELIQQKLAEANQLQMEAKAMEMAATEMVMEADQKFAKVLKAEEALASKRQQVDAQAAATATKERELELQKSTLATREMAAKTKHAELMRRKAELMLLASDLQVMAAGVSCKSAGSSAILETTSSIASSDASSVVAASSHPNPSGSGHILTSWHERLAAWEARMHGNTPNQLPRKDIGEDIETEDENFSDEDGEYDEDEDEELDEDGEEEEEEVEEVSGKRSSPTQGGTLLADRVKPVSRVVKWLDRQQVDLVCASSNS